MTKGLWLAAAAAIGVFSTSAHADEIQAAADAINSQLAASGANYRLEFAEWYTVIDGETVGVTRFFNDRGNKQLSAQFVPGDTRRAWSGPGALSITWSDDTDNTLDVSVAAQDAAIASAMATWEGQKCSEFGLSGGTIAANTGLIGALNGGVFTGPTADIMQSGFRPGASFVAAFGPSGNGILGVHFGFVFIDLSGAPTDINNDGFSDKALGDIYYNDGFAWSTSGSGGIDIETVVLHESGHGLSQQHFGTAFLSPGNGELHFAPRAVMNAAYSGVQRQLSGTDRGGHCSLWGSWPE